MRIAALLCALAAPLLAGRTAEPISSGRFVVLTGLPGDLESEREYQRRIDLLAEALKVSGAKPTSTFFLVDNPAQSVIDPAFTNRLAGDRAGFLKLGESLGKSAESVTVLVTGHGGLLRNDPVFHVRGERIAAKDFAAFATSAERSGARTNWILDFTGSGEVERGLAGENRTILASENAVRFQSDPLGFSLFVAEWRKDPVADLETIARRAGPRIAARYKDRGLARTEEPTLFVGSAGPVLLAELTEPAPSATPGPPEAGDKWSAVKRVKPAEFPDQDAVVLRRSVHYTLGESPAIDCETEEYIQVLTSDGMSAGDFDISVSPPDEEIEFLALEVLTPVGKTESLDPASVMTSEGEEGQAGFKRFSLPGVAPGAILHVHFRRVWKHFPFPKVFLEIPLAGSSPLSELSVRLDVPRGDALHHRISGHQAGAHPAESATTYGRSLEWNWRDVPAFRAEVLSPVKEPPALQVSTFTDWREFASWYQRITREADARTPEIEATAASLTAGLTAPMEKVRALYTFVTQLRYVAIPLGVNSYRPHAAANVLRDRHGDCKDKSNLLNTLLRSVGIDASLVLVPRFRQADESVPGLAFNHAISKVLVGDQTLWLDPTDDVCPFGMLPPGDAGRNVLVIDGSTRLERLPDPDPDNHRVKIEISQTGHIELTALGYPGYAFREAARRARSYGGTLPVPDAAGWEAPAAVVNFSNESNSPPSQLEGPFRWSAETGILPAHAVCFLLPKEWRLTLQRRTQPLELNAGYPLVLEERMARPRTEPPPLAEIKTGPLRWRIEWKQKGDLNIGTLDLTLPQAFIAAEDVPEFQRSLAALYEAIGR